MPVPSELDNSFARVINSYIQVLGQRLSQCFILLIFSLQPPPLIGNCCARWKRHLQRQRPLSASLTLQRILVMPAVSTSPGRATTDPGQGDSARLSLGQGEVACPHLGAKGSACTKRLPSILSG